VSGAVPTPNPLPSTGDQLSSKRTTIKVLRNLINECRKEGVTHLPVDLLEHAVNEVDHAAS
jgi:hypothetical protein